MYMHLRALFNKLLLLVGVDKSMKEIIVPMTPDHNWNTTIEYMKSYHYESSISINFMYICTYAVNVAVLLSASASNKTFILDLILRYYGTYISIPWNAKLAILQHIM